MWIWFWLPFGFKDTLTTLIIGKAVIILNFSSNRIWVYYSCCGEENLFVGIFKGDELMMNWLPIKPSDFAMFGTLIMAGTILLVAFTDDATARVTWALVGLVLGLIIQLAAWIVNKYAVGDKSNISYDHQED